MARWYKQTCSGSPMLQHVEEGEEGRYCPLPERQKRGRTNRIGPKDRKSLERPSAATARRNPCERATNTKQTPRTQNQKQRKNDPVVFIGRKGQHATKEPQRKKKKIPMRGKGGSKRRRPHRRGQIGRLISLSLPKQRTLPRRALSFDWKAEERP